MTRWFSYDPDNGFEYHDTPEAARADALRIIDSCLNEGWEEDVEQVLWGQVCERATQVNERPDPSGEFDYLCDYELKPVGPDPVQMEVGFDLGAGQDEGVFVVGSVPFKSALTVEQAVIVHKNWREILARYEKNPAATDEQLLEGLK